MKSLTKVAPGPSETVQVLTWLEGNKTEKRKIKKNTHTHTPSLDLTQNNHSAPCLNLGLSTHQPTQNHDRGCPAAKKQTTRRGFRASEGVARKEAGKTPAWSPWRPLTLPSPSPRE